MSYLENINSPNDIKKLSNADIPAVCSELRQKIISSVSENGGHLASNLGIVELTVAIHRVFDLPSDKLIFDVGHQCYVHKLLTGRKERFDTLRLQGGISGFPMRNESEYDAFGAGHSGTSVSAALGFAISDKLDSKDSFTIAVVGDGSMTNGMIYEALNNCPEKNLNLIIVLNDNEMSISKNVGAMSRYLSDFSNSKRYIKFKNRVYSFCLKTSNFGDALLYIGRKFKNLIKKVFLTKNYFECLGLKYFGPIDGHDEELLELVFKQAKKKRSPCIIHVTTLKGKGYEKAETSPALYHSVGKFDAEKGVIQNTKSDFSSEFGKALIKLAKEDKNICAVTAAMTKGTGLSDFASLFPDRFFDVGIAEEHAVTFCAGLAAAGKKPVFAVYSSFFQRCYDQLLHDVALQKLPVIFAVDRASFVPGDGITHQGIFDVSFVNSIPFFQIFAPETYFELETALRLAEKTNSPSVVRYPKGCASSKERTDFELFDGFKVYRKNHSEKKDAVIITYGRLCEAAYQASDMLKNEYCVDVISVFRLKPLNIDDILKETDNSRFIFIVEEGMESGGIGEKIKLSAKKSSNIMISACQTFVGMGTQEQLDEQCGFLPRQIAEKIKENL